jgi:hypothetical protein
MAKEIAQEIKAVEDPIILCIYLKAIIAARCKIGGAKEGTCKGCMYQSNYCRERNQICDHELQIFENEEEQ